MLAAEIVSVISGADEIGDNVYNILPKYKKYEKLFKDKTLDDIKAMHKPELLKAYNEVEFWKTRKDVIEIYSSAMQQYSFLRYDLTNAIAYAENVVQLTDIESGTIQYIAADQVNSIIRYPASLEVEVCDPIQGTITKDINKDVPRIETFYST